MIYKLLLQEFSSGLIAMSAGLNGEIMQNILINNLHQAKDIICEYKNIFNDNFYLEIQNHNIKEELESHNSLISLSQELSVPLVATNETYYTLKEDAISFDVIRCIGTGHNINDPNRIIQASDEYYIKSSDAMCELFKEYPSAIDNTLKISEQCNVDIPLGTYHLPEYPITSGNKDPNMHLQELSFTGLKRKYQNRVFQNPYLPRFKHN